MLNIAQEGIPLQCPDAYYLHPQAVNLSHVDYRPCTEFMLLKPLPVIVHRANTPGLVEYQLTRLQELHGAYTDGDESKRDYRP